jgi:hypothetical protein
LKIFFNDIFLDFYNIHLNIILFKNFKYFKYFFERLIKDSKKILKIKQWFKGACVAPNRMVGPYNKSILQKVGKMKFKIKLAL